MQKIDRKLETVVVDGITDRFWWRWRGANAGGSALDIHVCTVRNTSARGTVFSSHTFAFRRQLGAANSGGFHEQVPRNVPNSDWQRLVWYEHADKMVDELRLHLTSTSRHRETCDKWPNDYESNVPAVTVGDVSRRGEGPAATLPTSAEAGYSCGGSGRRTSGVGSGRRCQGRTIGPTWGQKCPLEGNKGVTPLKRKHGREQDANQA